MAMPRKKRATIKVCGSGATAQASDPRTKITALIRIAPRRPSRLERMPLMSVPKTAPQRIALMTTSMTLSVMEKLFWMNPSAPEITPISRPKRSPASAAVRPMKYTMGLSFTEAGEGDVMVQTPKATRGDNKVKFRGNAGKKVNDIN